ncbi:hypothetical protein K437DRAFT_270690 [Tilletiaria anomala UBC 951]|uniref:Cryptic loci regulator 2 N-terminal domain-containing protein n=1 Tax=Tilletiaria anomala (strain ATCC 24038 / CBS 436.72 / UBC 951) TaxID=1037660 RepID=A0A066V932_TILAU|nr:uncharacterized protein K437DRAFT_270690 [Tilletiaria anomala UBC 951]KDN37976.1 hypothetical protein K437DRAFT_270690 [Tilletiaria anomala UBC 951]
MHIRTILQGSPILVVLLFGVTRAAPSLVQDAVGSRGTKVAHETLDGHRLSIPAPEDPYIIRIGTTEYYYIDKLRPLDNAQEHKEQFEWLFPYPDASLKLGEQTFDASVVHKDGTTLRIFPQEYSRFFSAAIFNKIRDETVLPEHPRGNQLIEKFEMNDEHNLRKRSRSDMHCYINSDCYSVICDRFIQPQIETYCDKGPTLSNYVGILCSFI